MTRATTKAEAPLKDHAPDSVVLTDAELAEAHKDGAKEDAKKAGEAAHHALTDGSTPGVAPDMRFHGWDEIQPWASLLDLGVEAFEAKIAIKSGDAGSVPDEKVFGLLNLERNGKNRTPYVKAMVSRIDLKRDEIPGSTDYTNDLTSLSDL